uniref:Uncharacterized protein n=1 Tax=Arundo donax TaxID=35708 RepID=A0A0A9GTN1_ARUDO
MAVFLQNNLLNLVASGDISLLACNLHKFSVPFWSSISRK